jgi:hypothetical protein
LRSGTAKVGSVTRGGDESFDGVVLVVTGVAFDINYDRLGLGELTVLYTLDRDISAVRVELAQGGGKPSPMEDTFAFSCAGWDIAGDLNWKVVINIGAGLVVATKDMEGFAIVVGQREFTGTSTMTSGGNLETGWGKSGWWVAAQLFCVLLKSEGAKPNFYDLAGLHRCAARRRLTSMTIAWVSVLTVMANKELQGRVLLSALDIGATASWRPQHEHVGIDNRYGSQQKDADDDEFLHIVMYLRK